MRRRLAWLIEMNPWAHTNTNYTRPRAGSHSAQRGTRAAYAAATFTAAAHRRSAFSLSYEGPACCCVLCLIACATAFFTASSVFSSDRGDAN